MGNPVGNSFDGIHPRGTEAPRHVTYRAAQLIKSVIRDYGDHTTCPQAVYQGQSYQNQRKGKKSTNARDNFGYNVPTKNSFEVLAN